MKRQVKINDAEKSDDWKCTSRFNAGDDSYRVYESEKVGQRVVEDGKNESWCLTKLRGLTIID